MTDEALDNLARQALLDAIHQEYGSLMAEMPEHDFLPEFEKKMRRLVRRANHPVRCRMIQTAIDKRKRREWAHIYIAECDAKHLSKVPASLMNALSALSDRVRIIPMADDEAGTCIIETRMKSWTPAPPPR